ncbi:uncharacterized protein [Montipora capricornis]|uniref:uncharacterized protein n=1 Tax=Montipora capricornis TaxID=246305 RepID=UPI0035F20238
MKAELTANAVTRILFAVTVLGCYEISIGQADISEGQAQESQEIQEEHYEWSVWSPCSRTCGTGIQFRGQLCLRENKVLCVKQPRKYQTCNTQACPPGSPSFRDAQCSLFNGREIFVNGQKARWISYVRGDNHCLLFCYPYGGELFYYFGKAKDGTPCSKEPDGVCVRGRCKPVGCDKRLESGVMLDKCRLCGGNSTKCKPMRGSIKRLPSHFEKMSGYAELMVIPKGSTSVLLKDTTSNYLGVRRQNGEYVVNGHRIINWSGWYNVNGVELRYKRFKDNIKETIEIFGPTSEDVYVTSLLISGKLNTTFEYWKPIRAVNVNQDEPEVKASSQLNFPATLMEWGKWTACSSSCGGGIQVRARGGGTVSYFRQRETEVKKCNDMPCDKMMAQWSVWGQWNDCSTSCGGGARIRFRYCKKPRGGAGEVNSRCSGERYAVELCNVEECPTEGTRSSTSEIADNKTASFSEILLVPTSPVISRSGKASEFSKTFQAGSGSFSFPMQDVQKQKKTIKPWDSSYSVTGYELSTREKFHSTNVSLNFTVKQEASKSVPKAATAHASASVAWTSKSIGGDQFVIKTSFLSSTMEYRDRDRTLASMDKNTEFLALKPHSAIAPVQTYPKFSSMEILESETETSKTTSVLFHTVPSYSTVGNSQMRPFFLHLKSTQGTNNPTLQTLKTYQQESSLASAKEPLYLSIDESTDSQFNETIAKPFVLQTSTLIAFTKPNLFLAPSPSQSFNLTRAIEATLHEYTSSRSSTQASLARRFSSAAFKTPALVSTQLTAEISSLPLTSVLGSSTNTNEKYILIVHTQNQTVHHQCNDLFCRLPPFRMHH